MAPIRFALLAASLLLSGCGIAPGLGGGVGGDLRAQVTGEALGDREPGKNGLRAGYEWSYLALSASDNDLADDADMLETAAVKTVGFPNLASVMFIDRAKADDSIRLSVGPEGLVKEKTAELDSESPKAARELLAWGRKVAPSKRRVLVLADHGGGIIRGIMSDEHRPTGAKAYSLADYAKALKADPVDILYFDACFMQMVEVAIELDGVADVVMAAESETTSGKSAHTAFMKVLSDEPALSTDAAAEKMVQAGKSSVSGDSSLSAIRPRAATGLMAPMAELSRALLDAMKADPTFKIRLRERMAKAQQYVHESDPHYALYNSYRDLGDILGAIAEVAGVDVARKASAVARKLNQEVVISHVEARSFGRSTGLVIYAPADETIEKSYLSSRFAKETNWGDVLVALNSGGKWANPVQPDKYPRSLGRRRRVQP